jgi:hypothetical protein
MQTYFYDRQIRRFLLQFIRLMSNFQVETGLNSAGATALIRVPVIYGDPSRQAAQILANNTETNLSTTPVMAAFITDLKYDRARVQEPNFVSKLNIRERKPDPDTGLLTHTQGNMFTVERLMPVPYKLNLKLDIWTSNTEQKLQILEQILALYNPAIELQHTDNYVDWSSLSYVELTDVVWSSRTVPTGTENPNDVATLSFELPVWISAPVKVKKLGVVEKIIASIYETNEEIENAIIAGKLLNGNRQYITPLKYSVLLLNGLAQLVLPQESWTADDVAVTLNNDAVGPQNWNIIIGLLGDLRNGISQLRLSFEDGTPDIVGYVTRMSTVDPSVLLFNVDIDTIPVNTLLPIDAIINPQKSIPGGKLSAAASGQRYLLLNNINEVAAWGLNFIANANDIIEYNGTNWTVSFSASDSTDAVQYVTNLNTGVQYKWDETAWIKSYEGEYPSGRWHLVL